MNRSSISAVVTLAALIGVLVRTTASAQPADAASKFERGFPALGTAEKVYEAAGTRALTGRGAKVAE